MKVLVSFILVETSKEIKNCECDADYTEQFYKDGGKIEIDGEIYKIHSTFPSINGHLLLKVNVTKVL